MSVDGGELSKLSKDKNLKKFLESDGYTCQTMTRNFTYSGWDFTWYDCECDNNGLYGKISTQ